MGLSRLIEKYDGAGPRYTSYPTAPQWVESCGEKNYQLRLREMTIEGPCALYVHVPFCESLCLYCGCNIQITRDHGRARPYVETLCEEMRRLTECISKPLGVSQVSWGGGTPTYLSSAEINLLFGGIRECFTIDRDAEISIEIDPRVTSDEKLVCLRELGFNRVSLGVQDFDPLVQQAVHRVQSPEMTIAMLARCRELGFSSINYDLIYGLPGQTEKSFSTTVEEVLRHKPDRIALYNYAHLPSLRPHQRSLDRFGLPDAQLKTCLFEHAYLRLTENGYGMIGMDHFARKTDELFLALMNGTLYRNFQGYTVSRGFPLFGFGASAISELPGAYFQNTRDVKTYEERVKQGFATLRGIELTNDDERRKWIIQSFLCQFCVTADSYERKFRRDLWSDFSKERDALRKMESDGLVQIKCDGVVITELGRLFARHVAMAFDTYLGHSSAVYSKTL